MIVWLDYAAANKRGEQLGEFRQLLSHLASGDVAKITLNANSQSFRQRAYPLTRKDFDAYLKNPDSPTHRDYETYLSAAVSSKSDEAEPRQERSLGLTDVEYETVCIENLKEQLGEYLPKGEVKAGDLDTDKFAAILAEAVKIAALKGVGGSKLQVLPLGAFRYSDGEHQMLTVTTILADETLMKTISEDQVFVEWPFRATEWAKVNEVSVPDLSAKERHFIEGLISKQPDPNAIHQAMPFRFHKKEEKSLSLLKDFLLHYRRYPTFARIQ